MGTSQSNQSTSNGGQSAGGQKQAVGGEVSGSQKQEKEQAEESHARSERHCEVTGHHQIGSEIPEKQQQQTSGLREIKDNNSNTSTPVYTMAEPPKIVLQPQSITNQSLETTVKLNVKVTGREPLNYTWEWNPTGLKCMDKTQSKVMKGKAASNAIQKYFDKLCVDVTPEDVAPAFLARKIITRQAVENARNKLFNSQERAQALLEDLMRKVEARPEWFHDVCDILEEALVQYIQTIRDEYERQVKEAEGWKPIASDGGRYEGVHSATLTITSVQSSDQGGYRCTVCNAAGSETSEPAVVTVAESPRMTSHPQENHLVIQGAHVQLTVVASGTEPLQYSWMYRPLDAIEKGINTWLPAGGKEVQGADTPTLTIIAAHESHQGRYRCVVSNLVGSETSSPALLCLARPPRIISHPQCEKEVLPQEDVPLSVEAGGSEPLWYSWEWQPQSSEEWLPLEDDDQFEGTATAKQFEGTATAKQFEGTATAKQFEGTATAKQFEGTATAKMSITNIQESNSGSYRCVVTNSAGTAVSNVVPLKVLSADEIVSHLRVVCIDEGTSLEDKIEAVKNFVYKYGSRSKIVSKGLIMVVKMEKEELAIVQAFISDPCFVPVQFVLDGWTPLQYACMQGHAKITNLLLANGAKKRVQTEDGKTLLHLAAERGHYNVIMFLNYNKADVNAQANDGRTALHFACEAAKAALTPGELSQLNQVVAYLLHSGARVDLPDKALNTPLHIACKSGNSKQIVELILEYDKDSHCVNSGDREKNTPLHLAAAGGFQAITDLLLQKKGDVTCLNEGNNTPLHVAILGEHGDVARILTKQMKRDFHSLYLPNKDGNTPLHLACAQGMTETVRKILTYHARPINSQNKDGNTPLHLACQGGFQYTVKYLLRKGADANITNKDGYTPAALAKLRGNKDLLTVEGLTPKRTRSTKCYTTQLSGVFGDFESSPETPLKVMSRRRCQSSSSASDTLLSGSFSRSLVPSTKVGLKARAAKIAFTKCFDKLAAQIKTEQVAPSLFAQEVINDEELAKATNLENSQQMRVQQLLQPLMRRVEGRPELFDTICSIFENNGVSAVQPLRDENQKQLKFLELEKACHDAKIDTVRAIVYECGPDSEIVQKALMSVVRMEEEHVGVLTLLLDAGVSPNVTLDGWTPLQYACMYGHPKFVRFLIEKAADKQVQTEDGRTILHLACENGYSDIVSYLLFCGGVSVDETDEKSRSALHYVCSIVQDVPTSPDSPSGKRREFEQLKQKDILTIIHNLLLQGARTDVLDDDKNTPLHIACKSGNIDVVRKLLEKDVEYKTRNAQNNVGNTPLHIAAMKGFRDIAELLVKHGGNPDILNQEGQKPANSAEIYGFSELAQLLSNPKELQKIINKSKRRSTFFVM